MKTLVGTYCKSSLTSCSCLLVLLFLQLAVLGCGRVGDPLPPIRYSTLVPESVLAMQRGSELIITWPKPTQISLERSKIVRAEILRREESATDPKRLTEESFIDNAQIIGSLSVKDISEIEGKTVRFVDILDPENIDSSKRYRYAVRYVQFTGVSLPLSSYAFAEPITTVAKAPEELNVEVSQTTIKLSWKVPAENIDLTPANVSGYNIYRKTKNQAEELLSPTPVTITVFEDRKFKFETEYTYRIRTLSQGREGLVEGPVSMELKVNPKDSFPPAKPTSITAASAAGIVSVFWPSNSEVDLKGYNIYRRETSETDWSKITPEPIVATTFRDETTEVGKVYIYYITALDRYNNESQPSEFVEVEVVR